MLLIFTALLLAFLSSRRTTMELQHAIFNVSILFKRCKKFGLKLLEVYKKKTKLADSFL